MEADLWGGLAGPPNLPAAVITRLSVALREILTDPPFREAEARDLANVALAGLKKEKELRSRTLYASQLRSTVLALLAGRIAEAQKLHAGCDESLRGWEWHNMALSLDHSVWKLEGVASQAIPAWSPDGTRLAVPRESGSCTIHDALTGERLFEIKPPNNQLHAAQWHPNGMELALFSHEDGGPILIFDPNDGRLLSYFGGAERSFSGWSWSPAGNQALLGGSNLEVVGIVRTSANPISESYDTLSWSPDGSKTGGLSLRGGRALHIWDTNLSRLATVRHVNAYSWNPASTRVIVAHSSEELPLAVYDAENGGMLDVPTGENRVSAPQTIAWSPDGSCIALASQGNPGIVMLNEHLGHQWHNLTGHTEEACWLRWSPDSRWLASTSYDDTLRVWDMARKVHRDNPLGVRDQFELTESDRMSRAAAWSPDGTRVVGVSENGHIQVRDGKTGRLIPSESGASVPVSILSTAGA